MIEAVPVIAEKSTVPELCWNVPDFVNELPMLRMPAVLVNVPPVNEKLPPTVIVSLAFEEPLNVPADWLKSLVTFTVFPDFCVIVPAPDNMVMLFTITEASIEHGAELEAEKTTFDVGPGTPYGDQFAGLLQLGVDDASIHVDVPEGVSDTFVPAERKQSTANSLADTPMVDDGLAVIFATLVD